MCFPRPGEGALLAHRPSYNHREKKASRAGRLRGQLQLPGLSHSLSSPLLPPPGSQPGFRRQGWSLESETRFLSTKPQGRTAREVLTRWQPRAVCEDQVTVLESRLCEAARVTWMFALSVWQRCHMGTKSRKAVALAPREGGLLPASRPCLMRICPTGPWPRRAGSRARGRTGPSDLPSTPAPASCLGVGQFVLHRACLQSQGDKTFVCNPGKRKLCGRRQPLGSRPPRGARSTGAASLRCPCKAIHPWLPAGRTPPRKNLSSSINRAF